MASPSPRHKSVRSETSVRTYAKIRKSELDLEKECNRLEQQMVNRLTTKEREIQQYMSKSPSQNHSRRSSSSSADEGANHLSPTSIIRPRSASSAGIDCENSSSPAKPDGRSASVSQSPRPSARKKLPPVLPTILVDGNEEMDKESQIRMILSSEPASPGNSPDRKCCSGDFTPSLMDPSPPCSPVVNHSAKPKKLQSSSTDALMKHSDLGRSYSLEPVERTRAKSASSPRPSADRSMSLPIGSPDTSDKKTLLEMAKCLPDMKGKDGFKQFYQTSSPKPKRK